MYILWLVYKNCSYYLPSLKLFFFTSAPLFYNCAWVKHREEVDNGTYSDIQLILHCNYSGHKK